MGRKSIKIEYIENRNHRASTYRARAHGFLKKAHELGVLCGIKVSLVFNNMEGDVISYSNNQDLIVLAKDTFNQGLNSFSVDCFTPKSVSFF